MFITHIKKKDKFGGEPSQKKMRTYDRIFFCREFSTGENFVVLSETLMESMKIMFFNDVPFVGGQFVIYEPSLSTPFKDLPSVKSSIPFIPVKTNLENVMVNYLPSSLQKEGKSVLKISTFLMEVKDLEVLQPSVLQACGITSCGGSHIYPNECYGIGVKPKTKNTMKAFICSDEGNLPSTLLHSHSLAWLFYEKDSFSNLPSLHEIDEDVDSHLEKLKDKNAKFYILGWLKKSTFETAEDISSKLHISSIMVQYDGQIPPIKIRTTLVEDVGAPVLQTNYTEHMRRERRCIINRVRQGDATEFLLEDFQSGVGADGHASSSGLLKRNRVTSEVDEESTS